MEIITDCLKFLKHIVRLNSEIVEIGIKSESFLLIKNLIKRTLKIFLRSFIPFFEYVRGIKKRCFKSTREELHRSM